MAKLLCLSLFALSISTATARPHPWSINQVSDNDLIDGKNLDLDVLALNSLRRGNIEQYSDNDLIDLKNLKLDVLALNNLKRHSIEQLSDDDLVDAKNLDVDVTALNNRKRGNIKQSSDDDLIDLKNLDVDVSALNSLGLRDVVQKSDNDLVDAKNSKIDIELLNNLGKRSAVDTAFDVLRRANYDVDLLSSSKRSTSDMYQTDAGTHTCFCAKKKVCSSGSSDVFKAVPTVASSSSSASHAPTSASTSTHQPKKHHHHHHHHHSETTSSSTKSPVRTPSSTVVPSCPSGWKQANKGDVIQSSDNDLVDLKNLTLKIDILNGHGDKTSSESVPATDKPACTGKYCCYKTEKSDSVVQKNDDDLVDLKNTKIGVSLLNNIL